MYIKYFLVFNLLILSVSCQSYLDGIKTKLWALGSCLLEENVWECAREKSGKMLDFLDDEIDEERRSWQKEADDHLAESSKGRTDVASDRPSRVGSIVELTTRELFYALNEAIYGEPEAEGARKKGGIDTFTVMASSSGPNKKKMKKKKPQFHIIPASMMMEEAMPKGLEVEDDKVEEGKVDESSRDLGESRGKKKKKKKAILKLLILGAVLKAKLSLLLQILSFKLQVKFFLIALAGLIVNIARFWLDVKKGSTPQKVIYYEHAQHQHHYDHEDEGAGWSGGGGGGGYWSRSLAGPKEDGTPVITEEDTTEVQDLPYRSWIGKR